MIAYYQPRFVLLLGTSVEQAIGKAEIEQVVSQASRAGGGGGGGYLGALQHPSYNRIQGRKFLPTLFALRRLAQQVQRPDVTVDVLRASIHKEMARHIPIPPDSKPKTDNNNKRNRPNDEEAPVLETQPRVVIDSARIDDRLCPCDCHLNPDSMLHF